VSAVTETCSRVFEVSVVSLQEIEQICIAYHHLCQDNDETLSHVDSKVQSEIDATSRCLNWAEDLLGDDEDKSGDDPDETVKFDIKF